MLLFLLQQSTIIIAAHHNPRLPCCCQPPTRIWHRLGICRTSSYTSTLRLQTIIDYYSEVKIDYPETVKSLLSIFDSRGKDEQSTIDLSGKIEFHFLKHVRFFSRQISWCVLSLIGFLFAMPFLIHTHIYTTCSLA